MTIVHQVPIVDISPYVDPEASSEARAKVIEEVKSACSHYGFLQIKGHGVPLESQRSMFQCSKALFDLPQEQKNAMSLKNNAAKRGYERIGEQTLDSKALPDCKEGFYIGREVPADQIAFLRGPNQWPDLPETAFHEPVTQYYQQMLRLSTSLLEMLVIGLDLDVSVLKTFVAEPVMNLKLLHYPPHISKDARQFGAGAHTDFGAITILLQQPGKHGLQVYYAPTDEWLHVPAVEDVFVINMGDLIQKWTDGKYSSTLHRVINAAGEDRYSVPCFFQGDLNATNPFKPGGDRYSVPCFFEGDLNATNPFKSGEQDGETVEQHIRKKYDQVYGVEVK